MTPICFAALAVAFGLSGLIITIDAILGLVADAALRRADKAWRLMRAREAARKGG